MSHLEKLTPTDHRLIELAGQDYSDLVMAQQLNLSHNAIEKRWAKLRKLFGVHSRAAVLAHRQTPVPGRQRGSVRAGDQACEAGCGAAVRASRAAAQG